MSIYPPFDFPSPDSDGQEYYPIEGDINLGYKWDANDAVWRLIKQIPNPDVTRDYVDTELAKLDGKIDDITDIVAEVVMVTAALDYTFTVKSEAVAAYRQAIASCTTGELQEGEDESDQLKRCRLENREIWNTNFNVYGGQFGALESPFVPEQGGALQGGSTSEIHYLKICEKDVNGNTVHWIDKAEGTSGAVSIGDFIQIVKIDGTGVDPGNYGFYKVVTGTFTTDRISTSEREYTIGLDFQHGSGSLEEGGTYRVRAVKQSNALTAETADERYLKLFSNEPQSVSGVVRFSPTSESDDAIYDHQVATKSYVDRKSTITVPIGAITAYAGLPSMIPEDWLWLDGSNFTVSNYPQLKAIFPRGVLPDFRGHHLVGYGAGDYGTLNAVYPASTALPKKPFKTSSYTHSHAVNDGIYLNRDNKNANNGPLVNYSSSAYNEGSPSGGLKTDNDNHVHEITGGGDDVTRPECIAICWIIKAK